MSFKGIASNAKKKFTAIVTKARNVQLIFSRNLNPAVVGRRSQSTSSNVSMVSGFFFAGIYTVLEIIRDDNERLYRSKNYVRKTWITDPPKKISAKKLKRELGIDGEALKAALITRKKTAAKELDDLQKITEDALKAAVVQRIHDCTADELKAAAVKRISVHPNLKELLEEYAKECGYTLTLQEAVAQTSDNAKDAKTAAILLERQHDLNKKLDPPRLVEDAVQRFKRTRFYQQGFEPIWDTLMSFASMFWLLVTVINLFNLGVGLLGFAGFIVPVWLVFTLAAVLPLGGLLYQWGRTLYYHLLDKEPPAEEPDDPELTEQEFLEMQLLKLAIVYKNYVLKNEAKIQQHLKKKEDALRELNPDYANLVTALKQGEGFVISAPEQAEDVAKFQQELQGSDIKKMTFAALIAFLGGYVDAIFMIWPFTSLASFLAGASIFTLPGLVIGSVLFTIVVGTVYAYNAAGRAQENHDEHERLLKNHEGTLEQIHTKLAQRKQLQEALKTLKLALAEKLAACNALLSRQGRTKLLNKHWNPQLNFPAYDDEPFFKRLDLHYKAKTWTVIDLIKMVIGDTSNGIFIAKGLLTTGIITLLIASPATLFSTALIYGVAGGFAAVWVGFKIVDYFSERKWQYNQLFMQEARLRDKTLGYELEAEQALYKELKGNESCLEALDAELQKQPTVIPPKTSLFSWFSLPCSPAAMGEQRLLDERTAP